MSMGITADATVLTYENATREEIAKFIIAHNTSQKPWKYNDYVFLYCMLEYSQYKTLRAMSLRTGYSNQVLANMLMYKAYIGNNRRYSANKSLKAGTFKINFLQETEQTIKLVNVLNKYRRLKVVELNTLHSLSLLKKFDEEIFIENYKHHHKELDCIGADFLYDKFLTWV
jgi:hypothetical protein